jgi:hypothetical protein
VCVTRTLPLDAAEIKLNQFSDVVIEGEIETGDYDKLRNLIENNDNIGSIYLASPGGNVAEAIKIGRFVRALRLGTEIPGQVANDTRDVLSAAEINKTLNGVAARYGIRNIKVNYTCASACFFVFVAGVERSVDETGILGDGPALGIHRPFLTDGDLKVLSANEAMRQRSSLNYL